MAATSVAVKPKTKRIKQVLTGDVWVFETAIGRHASHGAEPIAIATRGAKPERCSGASGYNYALPTRDERNTLLPWPDIHTHVEKFFEFARNNSEKTFRLLASPEPKTADELERFAALFRHAPENCILLGRMLEILERLNGVRVIVLDANVATEEDHRVAFLDQYFIANQGLWNAEYVELVSFGTARSLIKNDAYAKMRNFRHRIFNADSKMYGSYEAEVCEILSVSYATKLVCLHDPDGTNVGRQLGTLKMARAGGLPIDELLIQ